MPEIEFSLRDFFHPLAITRLHRDFVRHERQPFDEWREWRSARLRATIATASATPFWRNRFAAVGLAPGDVRTAADLAPLPLLTKDDVRTAGAALHAPDAARHRARPAFTSGTSGHPVSFLIDRHARVLEFVYYRRHWGFSGYRLGDRFAQLNAHHFLARGWHGRVARVQPHLGRLLLNSAALSDAAVEHYAAALRRHRARFLKGLASPLYFLALLFQEHGITDIGFDAVFSTGENLVGARRQVLERVFHCRVLDSYGLLEQAASICECPDGGYHVNADYALHEFLPTAFRAADGAPLFAVVGTTLHNRSMPLLRYDVGDLVELAPAGAPCPCGRSLPRVKAVHGRTEDTVITPDGRHVTALFVVPDFVPGVQGVQFVQEGPRSLVVRLVPRPEFDARREQEFVQHVRALVGTEIAVTLTRVGVEGLVRGPTGKIPLVLSAVKRGRAGADGSEHAL